MKAVVFHGVGDMRVEDLPEPKPSSDEVLLRIISSGLCGTDVHMYQGTNNEGTFPFIPGHEWVAEVVEVGSNVFSLEVGDRVVADPIIPCHCCANCQDGLHPFMCERTQYYGFEWAYPGGFCEYLTSLPERLTKVPENVTNDEAAMTEGVSVPYHAFWGKGRSVAPHDRVCVFGTGPIGLLGVQIAKAAGASVMAVEAVPFRRQMAKDLGADAVFDPGEADYVAQIDDFTEGRGATFVLEASGNDQALAATIDVLTPEGTIAMVGHSVGRKVPMEVGKLIWKNATLAGSLGAAHYIAKTLTYMSRHLADVTKVITHRFPLTEMQQALELGEQMTTSAKILIEIAE